MNSANLCVYCFFSAAAIFPASLNLSAAPSQPPSISRPRLPIQHANSQAASSQAATETTQDDRLRQKAVEYADSILTPAEGAREAAQLWSNVRWFLTQYFPQPWEHLIHGRPANSEWNKKAEVRAKHKGKEPLWNSTDADQKDVGNFHWNFSDKMSNNEVSLTGRERERERERSSRRLD